MNQPADAQREQAASVGAVPHLAERHFRMANILRARGRHDDAVVHYRQALALRPDHAAAHNNLGNLMSSLGRPDEAIAHYRQALAIEPNLAETHNNLGILIAARVGPEAAIAHYRHALAIRPDLGEVHGNIGNALLMLRRADEAVAQFCKALALRPDLAQSYNGLGNALQVLGRLEEAHQAFAMSVKLAPRQAKLYLALAHSKPFAPNDPHLAAMQALARDSASLNEDERISLDFALAKAFADLNEPERSFHHLSEGNARERARIAYDEPATLARFDCIRATFTPELMREKSGAGDPSRVPVFVVGMPRSGTTLVEQILASHSRVFGAGEIDDFAKVVPRRQDPGGAAVIFPEVVSLLCGDDLRALGARYLDRIRAMAPAAERIVDKMPSNFSMVGLIHLALPQARIIHVRRDPVDTCLSCFSILFVGDHPYGYDLAELGRYYGAYERLMQHWRDVLPQGVMLEVRYEDVIDDIEQQARRLVAHCGLDWEEACLAFHRSPRPVATASVAQVRQPIYRSAVGRSQPYRAYLGPLLQALEREPSP
jgi:tetratricopeptide (TPR) repeat protein